MLSSCQKNMSATKQVTTTRLSSIRNRRTRLWIHSIDNMKIYPPLLFIEPQLNHMQGDALSA